MVLLLSVADKNLDQFSVFEAVKFTEILQKLGNEEFEMPLLQVGSSDIIVKRN